MSGIQNITIGVREETAEWLRINAERRRMSISKYASELLDEQMKQELGYEAAMEQFLSGEPKRLKNSGRYPRREEVYG